MEYLEKIIQELLSAAKKDAAFKELLQEYLLGIVRYKDDKNAESAEPLSEETLTTVVGGVNDPTLMQQMMDIIRDVREKLGAIQQPESDPNRSAP